jgi:DTW domain-containing protein YfiP
MATCLCQHVIKIESRCHVHIFQHPKEANHSKNTARLIPLGLSNAHLHIGKEESDFRLVIEQLNNKICALVYPSNISIPIELLRQTSNKTDLPDTLIFIDGSWKQAYGIIQRTPWLQSIPHLHFKQAPKSEYSIRHTKLEHSLSTLEAVAYGLNTLFKINTESLYQLQTALLDKWQGPQDHRREVQPIRLRRP